MTAPYAGGPFLMVWGVLMGADEIQANGRGQETLVNQGARKLGASEDVAQAVDFVAKSPELFIAISKGALKFARQYARMNGGIVFDLGKFSEEAAQATGKGIKENPEGVAAEGIRAAEGAKPEGTRPSVAEGGAANGGIGRFPEWRVGDPITKVTPEGSYPSWTTIRERYWQNRAASAAPGEFGPSNIGAMRQGAAPSARVLVRDNATGQIMEIRVVKELHHGRGGRGVPGYDTPPDLRELWPWEHAALDSSRRLDYTFLGFK